MGFLKVLGGVVGVLFILSSNYILYGLWNGYYGGGLLYGLSLYFLAGFTYFLGVISLMIIYLTSGGRDIVTGIAFAISGIIHFAVIGLTALNNFEVLLIWAPQTGLSIVMGSLFLYLSARKFRRRIVEIIPSYAEY